MVEVGAIAGAGAIWYGLYALMLFVTRPREVRPAPATQDLPAEPPAVASLLTSGWEFNEDAAESTLLDLAARKFYEFRQPADDPRHTTIHLPATGPDTSGLTPYERRVLDRVRELAVGSVVPLTALTFRDDGRSASWWKGMRGEVIADARTRGLSQRRLSPTFLTVLLIAAAGVGVVITLVGLNHVVRTGSVKDDFMLPAFGGLIAFTVLAGYARRDLGERDTPAGREAAGRWLGVRSWLQAHESFADLPPSAVAVWDRYLPYGAAVGTTRVASAVIDLGMGNRSLVWSSFGGTWHRVKVKYPTRARYGLSVGQLVGKILLRLAIGTVFVKIFGDVVINVLRNDISQLDPFERWINLLEPVLLGIGVAVFGQGVYYLVRLVIDLVAPATVTGQVLWLQAFRMSAGSEDTPSVPVLHYLAIDDGTAEQTKSWVLPSAMESRCDCGDTVTITAYPWSRRIKDITVVDRDADGHRAPSAAPHDPSPTRT